MKQFNYQSIFDIWVRLEMNVDHSELRNKTKKIENMQKRLKKHLIASLASIMKIQMF